MPPETVHKGHFGPDALTFLKQLARNNDRAWFEKNKDRYEGALKGPALQFIRDYEKPLEKLSPFFLAEAKAVGGSLFRIHRDVRFSKDKSPYKTHIGIQFRHVGAADTPHCPGWYLHVEPGASFVGVGIWHPDGPTLKKIRDAIVADPAGWKKATKGVTLEGDVVKRPPRGYDAEHPHIEDLKRKDFVASTPLTDAQVTSPKLPKTFEATCKKYRPFMQWITQAVRLPF